MRPHESPRLGDEHPVDLALRQALAPDPAVVERVRARAQATPGAGAGARWPLGLAWAVVLVLAILGALHLRSERTAPPAPVPAISVLELRAASPGAYTIHNAGGLVTVVAPGGRIRALVAGG